MSPGGSRVAADFQQSPLPGPARLTHVTVKATGTSQRISGVEVMDASQAILSHVTVSAVAPGARASGHAVVAQRYVVSPAVARARATVVDSSLYAEGTETSSAVLASYGEVLVRSSRLEAAGLNPTGLFVTSDSAGEAEALRIVANGTGSANAIAAYGGNLAVKGVLATVAAPSFATALNVSISGADQVLASGIDATVTAQQATAVYAFGPAGSTIKVLGSSFAGVQTALNAQGGGAVLFANTLVEQPVFQVFTGTTVTCAGLVDGAFRFFASTCGPQ